MGHPAGFLKMCSDLTCGVVPLTDDVVEAAVCFLVHLLHLVQGLLEVELQLVYLLQHQTAATGAPFSGALWAGRDKRDMNTFEGMKNLLLKFSPVLTVHWFRGLVSGSIPVVILGMSRKLQETQQNDNCAARLASHVKVGLRPQLQDVWFDRLITRRKP